MLSPATCRKVSSNSLIEKNNPHVQCCWLTTSPSTRVRTLSPISGEMSLPNCCKVVRNLFSLLSCLAPQAGGNCWLAKEDEEEDDGPLLKPLGGEGAPFNAVGEWLVPLVTKKTREKKRIEITKTPPVYKKISIFFCIIVFFVNNCMSNHMMKEPALNFSPLNLF